MNLNLILRNDKNYIVPIHFITLHSINNVIEQFKQFSPCGELKISGLDKLFNRIMLREAWCVLSKHFSKKIFALIVSIYKNRKQNSHGVFCAICWRFIIQEKTGCCWFKQTCWENASIRCMFMHMQGYTMNQHNIWYTLFIWLTRVDFNQPLNWPHFDHVYLLKSIKTWKWCEKYICGKKKYIYTVFSWVQRSETTEKMLRCSNK